MMSTTKRHPASMHGDDRRRRRRHASPAWSSPAISTPAPMPAGARPSPTACRCMPPVPMSTPNYRATGRAIHTNGPISGAFRGFGVPQAAIMQETLYDELAEKLGMDRLEFRLQNALRNGNETVTGQRLGRRRRHRATASRRCSRIGGARWPRPRHSTRRNDGMSPRRRRRLVLVWLRQHLAAQSLDHQARHLAPTARSCCTRARSISARARTP